MGVLFLNSQFYNNKNIEKRVLLCYNDTVAFCFSTSNTVHEFNYLYVETQGLAIAKHGHQAPANGGKQIRKIKEWYVFPDGTIELCRKDEKHSLVNNFGKPIFVLSIKSYSNGTR